MLALACVLLGCSDDVNPLIGTERPFTIWGVFNPKTDTHAVRVFEIQEQLSLVRPDPLDVSVRSVEVETGETRVWQDSVVQLPDGDYRHVFWDVFPLDPEGRYRLEAQRSDGETTTSEPVEVPSPIRLEVLEADTSRRDEVIQPILIAGAPPAMPRIEVEYGTETVPTQANPNIISHPTIRSYDNLPTAIDGGWRLLIDLRADFPLIQDDFARNGLPFEAIRLSYMMVRVHVGNQTWVSPIGRFDENFLVEPGVFTNVENGFGYVGAGYVEAIRFTPPPGLVRAGGFIVSQSADPDDPEV